MYKFVNYVAKLRYYIAKLRHTVTGSMRGASKNVQSGFINTIYADKKVWIVSNIMRFN